MISFVAAFLQILTAKKSGTAPTRNSKKRRYQIPLGCSLLCLLYTVVANMYSDSNQVNIARTPSLPSAKYDPALHTQTTPPFSPLPPDDETQHRSDTTRSHSRRQCPVRAAYPFRLCTLYSAFVTLMKRSSSLMGTQLVRVFIAFSKSDSSIMSLMPSINAADVACRVSRVVPKLVESGFSDGVRIWSLSPSSMKTSHTRSWAEKGIE